MDMLFISHFFDGRKLEINDHKYNTYLRVTKLCFPTHLFIQRFKSHIYTIEPLSLFFVSLHRLKTKN